MIIEKIVNVKTSQSLHKDKACKIINAETEVHNNLGFGFLEAVESVVHPWLKGCLPLHL